jgi:hypothetical protein
VAVNKFDIFRTSLSPNEANPPLGVHSNAVLTFTVTDQTFQAVPWRDTQVLHIFRRMDQLELSQRRALHRSVNALDVLLMPDAFAFFTAERSDHVTRI